MAPDTGATATAFTDLAAPGLALAGLGPVVDEAGAGWVPTTWGCSSPSR